MFIFSGVAESLEDNAIVKHDNEVVIGTLYIECLQTRADHHFG